MFLYISNLVFSYPINTAYELSEGAMEQEYARV